jgi:hypothetical protein
MQASATRSGTCVAGQFLTEAQTRIQLSSSKLRRGGSVAEANVHPATKGTATTARRCRGVCTPGFASLLAIGKWPLSPEGGGGLLAACAQHGATRSIGVRSGAAQTKEARLREANLPRENVDAGGAATTSLSLQVWRFGRASRASRQWEDRAVNQV